MRFAEACRAVPRRTGFQVFIWWVIVRTIVRIGLRVLYRHRCFGRSNVPLKGPVIYIANHQSHYDPPIVGSLVGAYSPLARSTLFPARPWGWIIDQVGGIPLHKGRGDAGALRTAIEILNAGGRVMLFPEGTRTLDGAVAEFQSGMLILVKRSGAPVVPVAVEGAYDIWPMEQEHPKLGGRLASRVGRPIPAQELLSVSHKAAMDRLRHAIDSMRLELRRELRDATGGRFPAPGPGDHAAAPAPS